MISYQRIIASIKLALAVLGIAVACLTGGSSVAVALNPQPLPPGYVIPRCAPGPCY